MEEIRTNGQLADGYYFAAVQLSQSGGYAHIRRKISKADVDLPSFYREHGSFQDLRMRGLGEQTKYVLKLVMEYGPEKAREVIATDIDKERQRTFTARISRKAPKHQDDKIERLIKLNENT